MSRSNPISPALERLAQAICDGCVAMIPQATPSLGQVENVIIIAHRGSHLFECENTLKAFDHALLSGADGIEFDVRWTSDGHPVIGHDEDCVRVFGEPISIAKITRKQLRTRVPLLPTLDEVIMRYTGQLRIQGPAQPNAHLMIELKARSLHPSGERSGHGFTHQRLTALREMLSQLEEGKDYHLMCLDPDGLAFIEASGLFHPKTLLSIATTNTPTVSQRTLRTNWGGMTGHYLLITDAIRKRHFALGQGIGVGFVESMNGLKRECRRDVQWLFTNDPVKLARNRRVLLEGLLRGQNRNSPENQI